MSGRSISSSTIQEAHLRNDREARFHSLYETHVASVARYISRRTSGNEVQDVLAETFLTAWRKLDYVPTDALPWLYRTARNLVMNRNRTSRRQHALGVRLEVTQSNDHLEQTSATGEINSELLAAIRALPEGEREALLLVAWEGLDAQRGAVALGCSPAAFRVRLHRARRKLRAVLPVTKSGSPTREARTPVEDCS